MNHSNWNKFSFAIKTCLIIGLAFTSGCVAPQSRTPPPSASASNEYFDVTITQINLYFGMVPAGFDLTIINKTSKEIEVDWNRTSFVHNGSSRGGFMFEGINFSDRNNPKQPDFVFANSTFKKEIYPTANASFRNGSWGFTSGFDGSVGVSLSTKIDGNEVRQNIALECVRP